MRGKARRDKTRQANKASQNKQNKAKQDTNR